MHPVIWAIFSLSGNLICVGSLTVVFGWYPRSDFDIVQYLNFTYSHFPTSFASITGRRSRITVPDGYSPSHIYSFIVPSDHQPPDLKTLDYIAISPNFLFLLLCRCFSSSALFRSLFLRYQGHTPFVSSTTVGPVHPPLLLVVPGRASMSE